MDWRVERLTQGLLTVFLVITLSFVIIRFMPGNPMDYILAQMSGDATGATSGEGGASGSDMEQQYELVQAYLSMNPSDPLHVAYFDYMSNTLRGDLGQSIYYSRPVSDILGRAMPWTLFVLSWGLAIGFVLGIITGSLIAYWEGSKLDVGLTAYSVIMGSIPYYVLALLLIVYMAYRWQIFPTNGRVPEGVTAGLNWPFIKGIIYHASLPIASTVVFSGIASLSMRGNAIRVLGEDYLRVARLRGLSDGVIATQYVARNAILPLYTGLMISIGSLFGGSVILETIFRYRGMGYYLVQAANARDYPLMMGGFMLLTICVVIALFITDLTYGLIDPRAGDENREAF
ncbi:ABC transporter permease [Saliphagus infecundisoli]|uniref:ABC transporter permease n=1 Tax=Saliphagus infecundisoli TaxID=1849069 RepID=A0ABD5QIM6_9EURY|nr:ABC transporter permease [Saliphagus infecundisoli]